MNQRLAEREVAVGKWIQIYLGDLCDQAVDAIVNAANSQLQHGGGVAAAIVRRGGEVIQAESDAWVRRHGPADHDHPALTSGGNLPCQAVIHAVGPVWHGGDRGEEEALARAYRSALRLASEKGFRSLAFPSISTGIFGYPVERAAEIALREVATYLQRHPAASLAEVQFVLRDTATAKAYTDALERLASGHSSPERA